MRSDLSLRSSLVGKEVEVEVEWDFPDLVSDSLVVAGLKAGVITL